MESCSCVSFRSANFVRAVRAASLTNSCSAAAWGDSGPAKCCDCARAEIATSAITSNAGRDLFCIDNSPTLSSEIKVHRQSERDKKQTRQRRRLQGFTQCRKQLTVQDQTDGRTHRRSCVPNDPRQQRSRHDQVNDWHDRITPGSIRSRFVRQTAPKDKNRSGDERIKKRQRENGSVTQLVIRSRKRQHA